METLFILAHGKVGKPLSSDANIRTEGAVGLVREKQGVKSVCFIGGKSEVETVPSIAEQMQEDFQRRVREVLADRHNEIQVQSVPGSNNTVANVKSVIELIRGMEQGIIYVMSNRYHLRRVETVFSYHYERGIYFLPAEEFVPEEKRAELILSSRRYVRRCIERALTWYSLVDRNYRVPGIIRTYKRRRVSNIE